MAQPLAHTAPYAPNPTRRTLNNIFILGVTTIPGSPPAHANVVHGLNGVLAHDFAHLSRSVFLHPHTGVTQRVLNLANLINPRYRAFNMKSLPYDVRYQKPCSKENGRILYLSAFTQRMPDGRLHGKCDVCLQRDRVYWAARRARLAALLAAPLPAPIVAPIAAPLAALPVTAPLVAAPPLAAAPGVPPIVAPVAAPPLAGPPAAAPAPAVHRP